MPVNKNTNFSAQRKFTLILPTKPSALQLASLCGTLLPPSGNATADFSFAFFTVLLTNRFNSLSKSFVKTLTTTCEPIHSSVRSTHNLHAIVVQATFVCGKTSSASRASILAEVFSFIIVCVSSRHSFSKLFKQSVANSCDLRF